MKSAQLPLLDLRAAPPEVSLPVQYLDLWPDPNRVSCMSAFNRTHTANFIDRRSDWHHLAVTWSKAGNGRTRIYKDGLLMAEVHIMPFLQKLSRVPF